MRRFWCSVTSARLRIRYADGRIADRILRSGVYVIGREIADIPLLDPNVSGKHAELRLEDGVVTLRDTRSTNGTWDSSGQRLSAPVVLVPNQPYRMGNCQIVLAEVTGHTTPPPSSDSPLTTDTPLSPYRVPDIWGGGRRPRRE